MSDMIEIPEDVLYDVFLTRGIEPVEAGHLVVDVKLAANAAANERLERPFKDSRR